ncbi:MAG: hypothetical protein AYP45_08915 [Candidatus Brocadia carolinensis]|uniref:Tetratricopeptide repeat protein n=1 Tax=Candidatus Brocadia carolinensis TaxID=1004156 RepID=A0A1V4ATJ7_9BACT|nr:MAG: hypothetical protein AYP45_08915 [Candidatus Brocadia caroliniensis]
MKLPNIIPSSDLLSQLKGVESGLLQRKRLSTVGLIVGTLQASFLLINSDWFKGLTSIPTIPILSKIPTFVFPIVIVFAIFSFFIMVWSRFWLKESQAPFRYTCSIADFNPILQEHAIEELAWLQHDLQVRLSQRIGRLFLLEEKDAKPKEERINDDTEENLKSHIHISGFYGIRNDQDNSLVIEVMPRVRIGPSGSPETLAQPVKYILDKECPPDDKKPGKALKASTTNPQNRNIAPDQYEQIIERVYFSIATEIYKQIQQDVKKKIDLLPTNYFRAVALFREAEDYAKSNTLDSYEEAMNLYEQANKLLDPSVRPLTNSWFRRPFQKFQRWRARFWAIVRGWEATFLPKCGHIEVMCARTEIGYANMLLSRRFLAGISGQRSNPVYEALPVAERALKRLLALPASLEFGRYDVPGHREALFDAYMTLALSWWNLGSAHKAMKSLLHARQIDPFRTEKDAMYLYVAGEIDFNSISQLHYFQRAIEVLPRFEVAQFSFATEFEFLWRTRPSLERNVAELVVKEYERVLMINPGNIGAWANIGYVYWLLGEDGDIGKARDAYLNGCEYKAIKPATFISELSYGLARLSAEQGDFFEAYKHYVSAVSAQLGQGVYHNPYGYTGYFFQMIEREMLERIIRYKERVESYWNLLKGKDGQKREFTRNVEAFVVNNEIAIDKKEYIIKRLVNLFKDIDTRLTQEEEERVKNITKKEGLGDFAEDFKTSMLEGDKTKDEGKKTKGEILSVLHDDDFSALIEKYLPTQRVTDAVYAFVLTDYGEACYNYWKRSGDRTWRDNACSAYDNAIKCNSHYVIPHYNLALIDSDRSSKELDPVEKLEPRWPDGIFARIEVDVNRLPGCIADAEKAEDEAQKAEDDAKKIDKAVEKVAEISRFQPREDKATKFWDETAKLRDKAAKLRNIAKALLNTATECKENADKLVKQIKDKLGSFLPHSWAVKAFADYEDKEILNLLENKRINWEKELDELHVRAFFTFGIFLSRVKKIEVAQKIFLHIREYFWPEDFNLHQSLGDILDFSEREFRVPLSIEALCKVINNDNFLLQYKINSIEGLNKLLKTPDLYDKLKEKKSIEFSEAVENLAEKTKGDRNKVPFSKLEPERKKNILKLNRFVLEEVYPDETPKGNEVILRKTIERWLAEDPGAYWALEWVSVRKDIFGKQKRHDIFHEALDARGRTEFFYKWVGDQFKEMGERDKALEAYCKAETTKDPRLLLELGRSYVDLGEKDKALETYLKAETTKDPRLLLELGQSYENIEAWKESLKVYQRAKEIDGKETRPVYHKVHYHNRIGRVLWALQRHEEAISEFNAIGIGDWHRNIVDKVIPRTITIEGYRIMKNWLKGQEEACKKEGDQSALRDTREAFLLLVREKYKAFEKKAPPQMHGETSYSVPLVVTPIVIEADDRFFPKEVGWEKTHPLFDKYIPEMRTRIETEMGVKIPGVRIRGAVNLKNSYIIIINEVPIVMGTVELERKYCPNYKAYPGMDKIIGNLQPAFNPQTGQNDGAWIDQRLPEKNQTEKMGLCDHFEYMINHLAAVLRVNLASFLGIQEVNNLLETWQYSGDEKERIKHKELVQKALPDSSAKVRFLQVLQGLVRESVPIINLQSILESFSTNGLKDHEIIRLIEAIRVTLSSVLPGNDKSYNVLTLSPAFEEEIKRWLQRKDGKTFFAILPEQTQELLSAVRDSVKERNQERLVIVTHDTDIRPFVRRLIELEFPRIMVLSSNELKPDLRGNVSGVITYTK